MVDFDGYLLPGRWGDLRREGVVNPSENGMVKENQMITGEQAWLAPPLHLSPENIFRVDQKQQLTPLPLHSHQEK